jgi:hypothetical protein
MEFTSNIVLGRWGLPQVLTALERLAAAKSLNEFTQGQNGVSVAGVLLWSENLISQKRLQLPLQQPMASLLPALCKTAATALPLVRQAVAAHDVAAVHGAISMLNMVMQEWCTFCPQQQQLLLRTRISCAAAGAGMLDALAQACEAEAAALQQQSIQVNSGLKQLLDNSNLLVGTWRGLMLTWPQEGWCVSSAHLAGTIAPAASLAYSILQHHSSATAEDKGRATDVGCDLALEISNTLTHNSVLHNEAASTSSGISSSSSSSGNREREVTLVQSDHVLKLLLVLLACKVQQQHRSLRGWSRAAAAAADGGTSKLAVPEYHSGTGKETQHIQAVAVFVVRS